jgi:hypothetical protein
MFYYLEMLNLLLQVNEPGQGVFSLQMVIH